MKSKTKTNRDLFARVFPRLATVKRITLRLAPVTRISCAFAPVTCISRAWRPLHVFPALRASYIYFPRLARVTRISCPWRPLHLFPALGAGYTYFLRLAPVTSISRAWRGLHVFASNSDRFIALLTPVVVAQSIYFGFLWFWFDDHSIEKRLQLRKPFRLLLFYFYSTSLTLE